MMGPQGNGTPGSPRKTLLLITDGVGWYRNGPTTGNGPIDAPLCDSFKNDGFSVAVIEVQYLDQTGDYWFDLQVAPLFADIPGAASVRQPRALFPGDG